MQSGQCVRAHSLALAAEIAAFVKMRGAIFMMLLHRWCAGDWWQFLFQFVELLYERANFQLLEFRAIDARASPEKIILQPVALDGCALRPWFVNNVQPLKLALAEVAAPDEAEQFQLAIPMMVASARPAIFYSLISASINAYRFVYVIYEDSNNRIVDSITK